MRIACCAIVLLYACLPLFDADINFFKFSVMTSLIGRFVSLVLWDGDEGCGGDEGIDGDKDNAVSCESGKLSLSVVNEIDDTFEDIVDAAVLVDELVFDVLVVRGGDGEDIKDVVIEVSRSCVIPSSLHLVVSSLNFLFLLELVMLSCNS